MTDEPELSVTDEVPDALGPRLKEGLATSTPEIGPYVQEPLAVQLHDPGDDGKLIGGLVGKTGWGWLSVELLWVDDRYRGKGQGRRLLAAAEAEGLRRGCHWARLNTFSFQAGRFYEGCGYRQVLTLDDYPKGHQRLFFTKPLAAGPGATRMTVPRRVRTARLLLRPFQESDLDVVARWNADPRFMRYMGPVMSREDAWRQLAMLIGHWELRGYGLWAVEHQGRLIGRIGLYRPEGWPDLEVGWALDPDCWGQGFATEGARAALDQVVRVLNRHDPISVISPGNDASIRLAERLGARHEQSVTLRGKEVLVYRHHHTA